MRGSPATKNAASPASSSDPAGTGVFPPSAVQELAEIVHQPPTLHGLERSRWRLADLRTVVPWLHSTSLAGLSQALKRLKIRRKRGRLSVTSPDIAYVAKMRLIERARAAAHDRPDQVILVYGDEFSLYRQPKLGDLYASSGTEPQAVLSHAANTRHRYAGFLEFSRGQVTWLDGFKVGVAALSRGLEKLREAYPRARLFLVWDNWPVHFHETVLTKAGELAIEILWLPTYAPWTNPIEKLWRWLTEDFLRHHRLATQFDLLKQKIAAFLDRFADGSPALLRYVGLLPD
jgi:hypothetical protein